MEHLEQTFDIDELRRTPTVSITTAARLLGISQSQAYVIANSGDLPTITLGTRRKRVPSAALLRMLEA
ncbi:helix-turn-helix domain-containing protein [Rhodococcus zopfii]|uniref:helix-turn-helix domain-containing protein n=1 Tax=Rhodococcus zopfii TaxID=43772 RepID=UPI003653C85B